VITYFDGYSIYKIYNYCKSMHKKQTALFKPANLQSRDITSGGVI